MTATVATSLNKLKRYRWLNVAITLGSVWGCMMLLPVRPPGMELLGVGPSWLLIWVVAWSINRNVVDGAIAGLILGFLQDAMTGQYPTHAIGLVIVGMLTARIQKQRFIQEDFVSISMIVFGMAVVAQTAMALQITAQRLVQVGVSYPQLPEIWLQHQRIALSSAILSSLWAPALYYPLNRWWRHYTRVVAPPGNTP